MNEHVRNLLDKMEALERELSAELHDQGERLHYRVEGSRVEFTRAVRDAHRRFKVNLGRWLVQSRPRSLLSIPFIYGMSLPLVLLDVSISVYQAICFPLYGIVKVKRRDYFVLDRHHLAYLNAIEKVHCAYCSYANGLFAYSREIAARTEQYWCPIKHARPVLGAHAHYPRFLDYGDPTDFHARVERLRRELGIEAPKPARNDVAPRRSP